MVSLIQHLKRDVEIASAKAFFPNAYFATRRVLKQQMAFHFTIVHENILVQRSLISHIAECLVGHFKTQRKHRIPHGDREIYGARSIDKDSRCVVVHNNFLFSILRLRTSQRQYCKQYAKNNFHVKGEV
jgi:hypothetical protein